MSIEDIEDKIGDDKEDLGSTYDENIDTWINENLWKKVGFKILGYFAWVIGSSFFVAPSIGWDWSAFLVGLRMTILPIIWAALDAQSRNREIQQHLEKDAEMAEERRVFNTKLDKQEDEITHLKEKINEKQLEIYETRAQLNASCETLSANKKALDLAEDQIKQLKEQ